MSENEANDWSQYKLLFLEAIKRIEEGQARTENAVNRLEARLLVVESNIVGYTDLRLKVQALEVRAGLWGALGGMVLSSIVALVLRSLHI